MNSKQYIGQEKGIALCVDRLHQGKKGTMLSMWMGTGKSRVAIEVIKYSALFAGAQGRSLAVIIACPLSLLSPPPTRGNPNPPPGEWKGELIKWWGDANQYDLYEETRGTSKQKRGELTELCRAHAKGMIDTPLIIMQSYDSWRQ